MLINLSKLERIIIAAALKDTLREVEAEIKADPGDVPRYGT